MMNLTQLLSLEISTVCNLSERHKNICPIGRRVKSGKELSDEKILEIVNEAYALGFKGFITFHFYNEPMMTHDRMFYLMDRIRDKFPKSRFLLWTNGTILIKDPHLAMFGKTFVSNYFHVPAEVLEMFFSGLMINRGGEEGMDGRLSKDDQNNSKGCQLAVHDFAINNQGDVHICCYDWKNEIKIGNVFEKSLKELAEKKWEILQTIMYGMDEKSPVACQKCKFKNALCYYDEEIYNESNKIINQNV